MEMKLIETTFKGQPLSKYSKEELIKIIEELTAIIDKMREEHNADLDLLFSV